MLLIPTTPNTHHIEITDDHLRAMWYQMQVLQQDDRSTTICQVCGKQRRFHSVSPHYCPNLSGSGFQSTTFSPVQEGATYKDVALFSTIFPSFVQFQDEIKRLETELAEAKRDAEHVNGEIPIATRDIVNILRVKANYLKKQLSWEETAQAIVTALDEGRIHFYGQTHYTADTTWRQQAEGLVKELQRVRKELAEAKREAEQAKAERDKLSK